MGFLRRLFGAKKPGPQPDGSGSKPGKDSKRRWSFGKHSNKDKSLTQQPAPPPSSAVNHHYDPSSSIDANKHAIAVAAATAAVAEAALAAAHAAAEVVRLTSSTGGGSSTSSSRPADADGAAHVCPPRWLEETAAVKIQSAFRGYLARRALRALKALVKLQALVRGHIVRKQTADMLRRMQTLVRLQAQARASRVHLSDNNMHSFKSSLSHYPVPEEYEHPFRAYSTKFDGSSILKRCSSNANFRNSDWERARFGSNWLESWMEENVHNQTRDSTMRNNGHNIIDDEKSDKILEVDTWKPNFNNFHHSSSRSSTYQNKQPLYYFNSDHSNNDNNFMAHESPLSKRSSSREVLPLSSLKLFQKGKEEGATSRTADNSPQPFSSSSSRNNGIRKGPFTPTRSECSWGFFSGYVGHPNYMANTESSRAKVRSQSAPRQRLDFYDRYGGSNRRSTVQDIWDVVGHDNNNNSERDFCDLRNKAYPPSSRLSRIGSTNFR